MDLRERFNVTSRGAGQQPMLFAHGFGCDQSMWRFVSPAFETDYRVVLFDLAGCGRAHPSAYDRTRHSTLNGYAADIVELCNGLDLKDVVLVGHSVSAIIALLAAIERPKLFSRLVLVAPSPCYLEDGDYHGGFTRADLEGLVDLLDSNYLGWASTVAPMIMGNPEQPALTEELKNSFCRTNPELARAFAKVTFGSDNRGDLERVRTPSLVMQVANDALAPRSVGDFMHRHLRGSELVVLPTRGHCPHMSAPQATLEAMRKYLARR